MKVWESSELPQMFFGFSLTIITYDNNVINDLLVNRAYWDSSGFRFSALVNFLSLTCSHAEQIFEILLRVFVPWTSTLVGVHQSTVFWLPYSSDPTPPLDFRPWPFSQARYESKESWRGCHPHEPWWSLLQWAIFDWALFGYLRERKWTRARGFLRKGKPSQ